MAKKIEQIRFYSQNDDKRNCPANITMNRLISGSAFNNKYPILQLGIQTLPGVKFYLNNGITPIVVGYTGIYDLDLEGITEITQLNFDKESIQMINSNQDSYLIVDLIHEGEG